MQRPSPRFRSQQFLLSKICGEIFYPDLYGDAMLVPIQMGTNMVAENQQKHHSVTEFCYTGRREFISRGTKTI